MNLRLLIREHLLLEKRIGQISSKIEVIFGFDVITTKHSRERGEGRDIEGYNQTPMSNSEILEVVSMFRDDISEKIATGDIKDKDNFVIISNKWGVSIPMVADKVGSTYWRLIVKTVFRSSDRLRLRVGEDQVVIEK